MENFLFLLCTWVCNSDGEWECTILAVVCMSLGPLSPINGLPAIVGRHKCNLGPGHSRIEDEDGTLALITRLCSQYIDGVLGNPKTFNSRLVCCARSSRTALTRDPSSVTGGYSAGIS
ncbi:hypothetical protein K439DRAFT_389011 [Ramaria rubella]|nr:hypothetical protein K439DRAFT_389011 [Ramaria rubella]